MQDEWTNRSRPIQEDMRFQRMSWRVQHAGWTVLAAAILAALLGVFSNGWLSRASAEAAGGALRIDYQRVYRNGLEAWLDLTIAGEPGKTEREIVLSPGLLERLTLEFMQPEPLRAAAQPDGLHLVFAVAPAGESRLRLSLLPHDSGGVRGTVRLADRDGPATLEFLILP